MDDYEKKYKEALEKAEKNYKTAQDLCEGSQIGVECFKNTLTNIFPELAESEDERIRTLLISSVKNETSIASEHNKELAIAWLEKQGEPNPYSGTSFKYNGHTWGMCARDNGVEIIFDGELKAFLSSEKSFIYPIHPQPDITPKSAMEAIKEEKVDNQNCVKPADMDEPKFKVGNWYLCTRDFFGKGVTFDKNTAYYCAIEGCLLNGCHIAIVKDLYDNFKLWALEDAKDGDVLVSTLKGHSYIYIFKEIENNAIVSHVYYCPELNTISNGIVTMANTPTIPATKEQRDALMKAMADAGYTFDFEKKELKKLKFRVGDEVTTENEGSLTITKIDEKGYWSNDLFICDFDSECVWDLVEQKSADKKELKKIKFNPDDLIDESYQQQADDLIDVVTEKPKWSEEDEHRIKDIVYFLDTAKKHYASTIEIDACINWLKSLKERIGE